MHPLASTAPKWKTNLMLHKYKNEVNNKMCVQSHNETLSKYFKGFKSQLSSCDSEYLVKLLEDVLWSVHIYNTQNPKIPVVRRILCAFFTYAKMRSNESYLSVCEDKIIPFIEKLFLEDEQEVQSFDTVLIQAREGLNFITQVDQSPIVRKIWRVCCFALTFNIFKHVGISWDSLGYTTLEQKMMTRKFSGKKDFVHTLADTALFVVERGYQIFKTGDMNCIFHSGGVYADIFDVCRVLKREHKFLNNPEEHGFTESSFRGRLDDIIEKLSSVKKYGNALDSFEKKVVVSTLDEMKMIRDDVNTRRAARRTRKAPFGILIFGESGIGKTGLTHDFVTFHTELMKLPKGPEYVYTRNPAAKYWDNFTSSMHSIVLDDVANEHPQLNNADSVNEIIQLMNTAAFCPDQADLDDKGRTPMKASLVVATTNVKNLNAFHYFSHPSAIQRRFPYIVTPTVKEELLNERNVLDTSLVGEPRAYPSNWTFKVEQVCPVPIDGRRKMAKLELVGDNMSQREFYSWFRDAIKRFHLDQTYVQQTFELTEQTSLCPICSLPCTMCDSSCENTLMGMEDVHTEVQTSNIILGINGFAFIWLCLVSFLVFVYKISNAHKWSLRMYIYYKLRQARQQERRENAIGVVEIETQRQVDRFSTRDLWQSMGDKVASSLGFRKELVALAGALTIGGSLYLIRRLYSNTVVQSGGEGYAPDNEEDSKENVWYNNELPLCHADFTQQSNSAKSMTKEQFNAIVMRNCLAFFVDVAKAPSRIVRPGKMLGLSGHVYVTNNHNIPCLKEPTCLTVIGGLKSIGVQNNIELFITEHDLDRYPEYDLVFVTLRGLPNVKNITKYLAKESCTGVHKGSYIFRGSEGEPREVQLNNIRRQSLLSIVDKKVDMDYQGPVWDAYSQADTDKGDCGAVMVTYSSFGYGILGLHVAKLEGQRRVKALPLTKEFVDRVLAGKSDRAIEGGDFHLVNAPSKQRPVGPLHKKSVFRYINEGAANIYGSFSDFRGGGNSTVCISPMSHYLSEHGYKIKFARPVMKGWKPWRIAALDLVKPITKLDSGILDKCVQSYISHVTSLISVDDVKEQVHILDDFTAVNGALVAYVDKMNRNTSSGNPWKKSKRLFMTPLAPTKGMMDPVSVDDEIMSRVQEIIGVYRQGRQAHPNFCAHLKDEPVSFKKAKEGKTRVFTGAPFDWSIVVRKYALGFTRLMQNNKIPFECAVATVAQSLEWQELFDHITKFGHDKIVAGDYKAFDKRMSPEEILAAFDVIKAIMRISGNYDDEDLTVVQCIAEDTAFALVDYNGDLVQLFGSNPSGNPLTVILNSIVNSLRMRYAYHVLNPSHEVDSFGNNVALITYGDDNIFGVSPSIDWYNHTSIQEAFASLDIVYTMADKEEESRPFIHIRESDFLKRKWRYDESMGCYLCPLAHDSIEKSLMVWNRSKTEPPESQAVDIIGTAVREYFFYGREVFEEKRGLLMRMVDEMEELDLKDWILESTFPTYDQLKLSYINLSRRSSLYPKYFGEESNVECERIDFGIQSCDVTLDVYLNHIGRKREEIGMEPDFDICLDPVSPHVSYYTYEIACKVIYAFLCCFYLGKNSSVVCDNIDRLMSGKLWYYRISKNTLFVGHIFLFNTVFVGHILLWLLFELICQYITVQFITYSTFIYPKLMMRLIDSSIKNLPGIVLPAGSIVNLKLASVALACRRKILLALVYIRPRKCKSESVYGRVWRLMVISLQDCVSPVITNLTMNAPTRQEFKLENNDGIPSHQQNKITGASVSQDGDITRTQYFRDLFTKRIAKGVEKATFETILQEFEKYITSCERPMCLPAELRGDPFGELLYEVSLNDGSLCEDCVFIDGNVCECDTCPVRDYQRVACGLVVDNYGTGRVIVQSENVSQDTTEQQENVVFDDAEEEYITDLAAPLDVFKSDTSIAVDLGDFLSRPVKIYSTDWQLGTSIDYTLESFLPWLAFFADPAIKRKLDNYYMLRCNLHVKFVINASPFWYGCGLASYTPLFTFEPQTIEGGNTRESHNVTLSQRPHVFLSPQDNLGGEIILPFLYHKNWLDATSAADLTAMGRFNISSMGLLQTVGTAVGESIEISVYAWAENLELAGPTNDLSVQSCNIDLGTTAGKKKKKKQSVLGGSSTGARSSGGGISSGANDEYGSRPVSKMASNVARVAGLLKNVPNWGPYAKATEIAATGVANVAHHFGYTNTPVIDNVHSFQPMALPTMATTDIGQPIQKLSIDAKNELSIDPRFCGTPAGDELAIANIVQKESYLGTVDWTTIAPAGTNLQYMRVSPMLFDNQSVTGATKVWHTPMSHLASMFQFWRGDIFIRLKVVCTRYHRGRLQLHWAPTGAMNSSSLTTTTYTQVIDITDQTDYEFRIPYTQPTGYLKVYDDLGNRTWGGTSITSGIGEFFNGTFSIKVLNTLSAPVDSSTVQLLMFVRGAENLEFALPKELNVKDSFLEVQSGDVSWEMNMGMAPSSCPEEQNLVYMGETIVSARQLMHRFQRYMLLTTKVSGTNNNFEKRWWILPRNPVYFGYATNGFHEATSLTAGPNDRFNFVFNNPINWMSICFVGCRGSLNYAVNPIAHFSDELSTPIWISRFLEAPNTAGAGWNRGSSNWGRGVVTLNADYISGTESGMVGTVLNNQSVGSTLMANVPMYSRFKFQSNNANQRTAGSAEDGTDVDFLRVAYLNIQDTGHVEQDNAIETWLSAGPDFTLVFYLSAPVVWRYTTMPAQVT